jgi:hypothetical protein
MKTIRLATLIGIVIASGLGVPAAWAEVPSEYEFQLQARSNSSGAFNIPDGAFFTSQTPMLNDHAEVAFKVSPVPSVSDCGVWFGGGGSGSIVYTAPTGAFLSGVTLNNPGMIVFEINYYSPDGLYYYDTVTSDSGILTDLPFGAGGWGSPTINLSGEVGYRAKFGTSYAWVSYDGVSAVATHVADVNLDFQSPYSYLFTPSFNDSRMIAGKVRLGSAGQTGNERPDQIRVFASDGSSSLIAEDHDSNPGSSYTGFDNSVSLTGNGKVAFVATLDSGHRAVILSDGTTPVEIASEALPAVSEIEWFGVAANGTGLVAFRGVDDSGLQAIFVGDGTTLERVIGEHDLVPTDLGTARIDQHDSSPVFGGSITINEAGALAFNAGLTPPDDDQVEWGSGIFVAYPAQPIFSDGFESGDTTEWSNVVP